MINKTKFQFCSETNKLGPLWWAVNLDSIYVHCEHIMFIGWLIIKKHTAPYN